MTSAPNIYVAGLGRCGSSLTMQMLFVAGVPCIGEFPDFEVPEVNHNEVDPDWLKRFPGHALKVLNPNRTVLPPSNPAMIIWLDRDHKQQALSQIKLLNAGGTDLPVDRNERRRWQSGLRRDRRAALIALPSQPGMRVAFEDLVSRPLAEATRISEFLRRDFQVDPQRMAKVVLSRSTVCQPDLFIENALIEMAHRKRRKHGGIA